MLSAVTFLKAYSLYFLIHLWFSFYVWLSSVSLWFVQAWTSIMHSGWDLLGFLNLWICVFKQFGKIISNDLLNIACASCFSHVLLEPKQTYIKWSHSVMMSQLLSVTFKAFVTLLHFETFFWPFSVPTVFSSGNNLLLNLLHDISIFIIIFFTLILLFFKYLFGSFLVFIEFFFKIIFKILYIKTSTSFAKEVWKFRNKLVTI